MYASISIRAQLQSKTLRQALADSWKERVGVKLGRPFNIMYTVYGTTYVTANVTERICKDAGVDHKLPTCIATSIVNIIGIAWKDIRYADLMNKVPTIFSPRSYALFALRDGITISSSFVFKHDVAEYLQENVSTFFPTKRSAELFSSFLVPMVAQLFSTPLHILALDLGSRPAASVGDRLYQIAANYKTVCSGRLMRIIPAFGIGGILNDYIKGLEHAHLPSLAEVVDEATDASSALSNFGPSMNKAK